MPDQPAGPARTAADIAALVQQLQDVEQQLRTLTAGQVDAVIGVTGKSYLMHEAQDRLLVSDREQRALAEQLRFERSRLLIAQAVARLGSWVFDLVTLEMEWSDEVHRILGTDSRTCRPTYGQLLELVHPADRREVDAALVQAFRKRPAGLVEHRLMLPGGIVRIVEQRWQLYYDEQGVPVRVLGTCQDLTERKQAQTESERVTRRLTSALESLTIGFCTIDREWRFMYVNSEAEHMLGRHREDLAGGILWELLPHLVGTELEDALRRAVVENRSCRVECRLPPASGWYLASAYPSDEGLTLHLRDITVERAATQQLKLLQASVAQINDMIVITEAAPLEDPGPRIEFVNDAFVRLTGFPRDHAIGRSPRMLQGPGTSRSELERMRTALDRHEPVRAELLNYRRDGKPYWVELDIRPVRLQGTKPTHFVSVQRDITERRRDQDALRELNTNLESRVRERTAELNIARNEAEQANHAKSVFLATMSHEIRTPMNGVIGLIDLLHQSSLLPTQAEMVDLIRESADSLLRIIDDILDFSKIEAGKLPIESAPMKLSELVEKVCSLLDSTAMTRNVGLTVFVDPGIPETVLGDEIRVRQVLMNLVGNAIKFSGGRQKPGHVAVRAEAAERAPGKVVVEITIADNGIGMDEETQARLFTPFTQADASTTRRFGGTGLGLTISSMLTRLMQGEISVESVLAEGSVFRVRLPVAVPAGGPEEAVVTPIAEGLRCLLVGGEPQLARDLRVYLEAAGFFAEAAPDLATAAARQESAGAGLWLWLLLPAHESPSIETLRAAAGNKEGTQTRFIVLGRGKRRHPRVHAVDHLSIDVDALSRKAFFETLALASGQMTSSNPEDARSRTQVSGLAPVTAPGSRKPHILVVDDNETNREVIRRQLDLIGATVELAVDGQEGLQLWRTGRFQLLLTDLRMPELDGYGMTAAIRSEEGSGPRLPILALTANALPEERARCLESGMDDYLVKPVRLPMLREAIEKWLNPGGQVANVRHNERAPPDASPPADLGVLISLIGDEPADIRAVLDTFRVTSQKARAEIEAAIGNASPLQAVDPAHRLKSGAFSIGASRLGELCAQIENAGEADRVDILGKLLPEFQARLGAVLAYLASLD